jgi:hypothetical protein
MYQPTPMPVILGVFCHVYDFLQNKLKMADETIGQVMTSSNCKAVYIGEIQHLWKEKFNHAHLHFSDRGHKIESMICKIRKESDIFSQSTFASETAQSDIHPQWDDKANVDKFIGNINKMNQLPVLETLLNKQLHFQHQNILEGSFTPNPNKPDQQVNILQYNIQFQPCVGS